MTMEWNRDHVVETVATDSQTIEKIAPICRLCGQKHWPLDPSCLGKKGRKARAKTKTGNKAKKTTQSKVQTEKNITQFAEKITRIKEESAKAISDSQKQLNAETKAKTKAQTQAQAEIKARIEAEKSIRKEVEARAEAEKEFQTKLSQTINNCENEKHKLMQKPKKKPESLLKKNSKSG
jgi:hypothetical protein